MFSKCSHLCTSAEGDNVQIGESSKQKLLWQFPVKLQSHQLMVMDDNEKYDDNFLLISALIMMLMMMTIDDDNDDDDDHDDDNFLLMRASSFSAKTRLIFQWVVLLL